MCLYTLSTDLIPRLNYSKYIYKAELPNLTEILFMRDVRHFADELGISEEKSEHCNRKFDPSNLDKGTFYLLDLFLKKMNSPKPERISFSDTLRRLGYIDISRKSLLGNCIKLVQNCVSVSCSYIQGGPIKRNCIFVCNISGCSICS